MNPADVKLSKGIAPKPVDPKRVQICPITGKPIGVWQGATTPRGSK